MAADVCILVTFCIFQMWSQVHFIMLLIRAHVDQFLYPGHYPLSTLWYVLEAGSAPVFRQEGGT